MLLFSLTRHALSLTLGRSISHIHLQASHPRSISHVQIQFETVYYCWIWSKLLDSSSYGQDLYPSEFQLYLIGGDGTQRAASVIFETNQIWASVFKLIMCRVRGKLVWPMVKKMFQMLLVSLIKRMLQVSDTNEHYKKITNCHIPVAIWRSLTLLPSK
ncbi:hypothetical protein P8452_29480 [Trifolium repens]|nr:hypothetical protein P8452_29480 [Trifolium repens]